MSSRIRDLPVVVVTFAIIGMILFPFFWMIISSLKPSTELLTRELQLIGRQLTLENYQGILEAGFFRFVLNSVFVCTIATIICVCFISSPAAYAISRYHFPGRSSILAMVGFTQMFPWVILVTPVFMIFWALRLVNSYVGLIIVYIAITVPFSIYMLLGYFETIPKVLDEAAVVDGCSVLGVIFRVILPISLPGLVATSAYTFAVTWNEFVFALTLMTQTEKKTVPVGVANFLGQYTTDWGVVMAASVVATVPTVIFFLLLQRHLVEGLAAGAVKQ
ncbi:MAG: carbohydrate ABC transporter permease [bacterium]